MGKSGEFDNILDECLERLAQGDTIEQCLAGYPEQAAALEPLLRTALAVKQSAAIQPRPEFRERARYQFGLALQEMGRDRGRRFFSWQPRWATAAVAVFVSVLVLFSGTVAAASGSMPDEPLYPVKLATEAVRINLTPSALGKAQLYAELADKRVAEIVKMADKGKPEQVEKATQRLDDYLQAVVSLARPAESKAGVMMAPAAAPPAPTTAAPPQAVPPAPRPTPTPAPAPAAAPRGPAKNADSARPGADKRDEVRASVASAAAANIEALKAALDRAPESAKPALRRAISISEGDYQRAIEALGDRAGDRTPEDH